MAQVAWHEPVVTVLLLIAAFTAIFGRMVNGVMIASAAVAPGWDGARHADQERRPSSEGAAAGPARRRRSLLGAAGLAVGGVLYAL